MQAIRFTYFVQQEEVDKSEKSESSVGDTLQLETAYLLHEKFTYLINEDSLDMINISHVQLPIEISDCPASSLIPRFINKTITSPSITTIGICISCMYHRISQKRRKTNQRNCYNTSIQWTAGKIDNCSTKKYHHPVHMVMLLIFLLSEQNLVKIM